MTMATATEAPTSARSAERRNVRLHNCLGVSMVLKGTWFNLLLQGTRPEDMDVSGSVWKGRQVDLVIQKATAIQADWSGLALESPVIKGLIAVGLLASRIHMVDGHLCTGCDLSRSDLSHGVLHRHCGKDNLVNSANLDGLEAPGANLSEGSYRGSTARGANFTNTNWWRSDLGEVVVDSGTSFAGAFVLDANLEGVTRFTDQGQWNGTDFGVPEASHGRQRKQSVRAALARRSEVRVSALGLAAASLTPADGAKISLRKSGKRFVLKVVQPAATVSEPASRGRSDKSAVSHEGIEGS